MWAMRSLRPLQSFSTARSLWSRNLTINRDANAVQRCHFTTNGNPTRIDIPRRLVRFLEKDTRRIRYALQSLAEPSMATVLDGDVFHPNEMREVGSVCTTNMEILAPIDPPMVLGVGLNYKQHAIELGISELPAFPILGFFKPSESVQHPSKPIVIPKCCEPNEVDWEVELAVVIGKHPSGQVCKDVSREHALEFVLGYTVANDISARQWQLDPKRNHGQWNRGKIFDTFCPMGPAMVLQESTMSPHNLNLSLKVNGVEKQNSNTSDLIFSVPEIIEHFSKDTTLLPGTVILTGTPQGVGMSRTPPQGLQPGDIVEAYVESIGVLANPVVAAK
eukprot:m.71226 g.71226  ORF g.71226 m.71226 type:complete len:333 (-) comp24330_c0_seq1:271-1269(-)